MSSLFRWVTVALISGGLISCHPSTTPTGDNSASPPGVQAPVTIVEALAVPESYEAVGTVRPKVSSTLQSKMTGHVLSVSVREGDRVESGQILVELDARETESHLSRAEGALREAQQARNETDKALQAAIQSRAAAEADNELAASTFARYQELLARQVVSQQTFDEANAKMKGAAAGSARADEMVSSLRAKQGEVDARIGQAEAEVRNAQTMLSFAQVTAPFAGIITSKSVEVGDLAAPGAPLLTLEDPQMYRLEVQVDEEQIQKIAPGATVSVMLDAMSEVPMTGAVSEIVPASDAASRSIVVKIDLPTEATVRSGMFGRARFELGARQTLVVPQAAVFQRGQLLGVYVVGEGDIARLRLITRGKTYDAGVEVLSGLDPGERIVSDQVDQVADGAIVKQG
ncbi:MAG: efflux RND transporter periplasmic adaptor subunit [Candidatus Hydrogenedentes bacterium]|nr:efflux RND transporter periplasmic adaptor subunit [Candidatus Hydrogenedentota bacterium]